MTIRFFPVAALVALASCSMPSPQQPTPAPAPRTVPMPGPKPVMQQPAGEWIDWPIEQGDWVYRQDARGSIALFGQPGADALVTMRCDRANKQIYLSRVYDVKNGGNDFWIRTHSARKAFFGGKTGGAPEYIAVMINPHDDILDAMAFTRGRIALEVAGQRNIAIPVWSELPRVIDDCRS